MIENIRHKGLKLLYEVNDPRKLNPEHIGRLKLILFALDNARTLQEMDEETFRLHRLKGNLKDFWAITIRANWRVIFRFEDGNVKDVDVIDYH